jgi:hypothetical protein
MRPTNSIAALAVMLLLYPSVRAGADKPKPREAKHDASNARTPGEHWEISGDLSEACTCGVPCTCNFGQGASPHHYCYALFALDIQKGHYGKLKLDGLHLAGAHAKKGEVWYIDEQATTEQASALRAIAAHLVTRKTAHFETARIIQQVGDKGNRLEIGDKGGFEADYIIGLDKKTPVVVENNTTWNIPRSTKGKTKRLQYKDQYGNKFDMRGTNSNEGKFDWTDQTATYF